MTGAVKLLTAGSGGINLQPASSIASDVTVNVPSVNTTLVGTDTTQTLTNKTLTTPNINSAQVATVSGTAPLYMCRAWVNFNGTGTVAIRASGNVSSITDNGTGDYTVNFTTAMPDTNYAVVADFQSFGVMNGANVDLYGSGTTTASRIRVFNSSYATADSPIVTFAAFR